jgi:ABC-type Fe3+ transport system permease subunit
MNYQKKFHHLKQVSVFTQRRRSTRMREWKKKVGIWIIFLLFVFSVIFLLTTIFDQSPASQFDWNKGWTGQVSQGIVYK